LPEKAGEGRKKKFSKTFFFLAGIPPFFAYIKGRKVKGAPALRAWFGNCPGAGPRFPYEFFSDQNGSGSRSFHKLWVEHRQRKKGSYDAQRTHRAA
jgi:hypothetical protein